MSETADPTAYAARANAFTGRRTYRLTEDALTWEEEGKKLDGVFYDEIAEVRVGFTPTRVATNRYRTQVIFRAGGMAEFFNTDYRGIANLAEQNAAYAAFVRELHRRLAEKGKDVGYRTGNSRIGYVLNIAVTVFIFAMVALAFLLLGTFEFVWIAAVKLAIILFFIPVLLRYIRRARPGTYAPLAVPAKAMPE
ncbi:hypothetical protein BH10PSE9_BH10PSE9_00980 [soil metagenome]